MINRPLLSLLSCLLATSILTADPPPGSGSASQPQLVGVERIWDQAPHNAFTDLVRFRDRWYCVFREGQGHVSPDGALRVITSVDGKQWESAALITSDDSDLRDAKITVTPDRQLMLAGAEAKVTPKGRYHQSLVWFSSDGKDWSDAYEVGTPNNWLWRITWHRDSAYGFGYDCGKSDRSLTLFKSENGKNFQPLIEKVQGLGTYPNETSMVFLDDGQCYCLLRQDGQPKMGMIGKSQPPYTDWEWQSLGIRLGGPDMIRLPSGKFVAVVRLYEPAARTSVCWLDPEAGTLTEALALPSGGDTSYAGLVWHDGLLYVSYYSSHEDKTSIYLAKVKIEE